MKNVKQKIYSQCSHINIGVKEFGHRIVPNAHNKIRLLIFDANRTSGTYYNTLANL